jgi:predicted nucleotidyltransferase
MDKEHLRVILGELRRRLTAIYGDRLAKMVLYGSQARGDAGPDSDIDVMVVLRGKGCRCDHVGRAARPARDGHVPP